MPTAWYVIFKLKQAVPFMTLFTCCFQCYVTLVSILQFLNSWTMEKHVWLPFSGNPNNTKSQHIWIIEVQLIWYTAQDGTARQSLLSFPRGQKCRFGRGEECNAVIMFSILLSLSWEGNPAETACVVRIVSTTDIRCFEVAPSDYA